MNAIKMSAIVFCISLVLINSIWITGTELESIPYDRLLHDSTLIAPGIGAEGILINEDVDDVLKRIGRKKYRISKPRTTGELFGNVLKVHNKSKIYFEALYYHEENKYTACVFHGKVVALIGLDSNRVTLDSVNLRSGLNHFLYSYGNKNCFLFKSDSNAIYIYPEKGIAVADDGMNDSIDLYIVFKAQTGVSK